MYTVPYLLLVEVAGAISRTRANPMQGHAFATAFENLPNVTFVALDSSLAQQAQRLAAQHGLRGADAVYAAVAVQARAVLLSLDNEHITRLRGVVEVRTPAEVLPDLSSL